MLHHYIVNYKIIHQHFIIQQKRSDDMFYIHMRINELLQERKISKNRICKDLDIPRSNFNRYCKDNFQRIDTNLIIKLCKYLDCEISDLLEIKEK